MRLRYRDGGGDIISLLFGNGIVSVGINYSQYRPLQQFQK